MKHINLIPIISIIFYYLGELFYFILSSVTKLF